MASGNMMWPRDWAFIRLGFLKLSPDGERRPPLCSVSLWGSWRVRGQWRLRGDGMSRNHNRVRSPGKGPQGMAADLRMRSLRARIAAFSLHSQYDARETTAAARSAFLSRFEREVDPDGTLSADERSRRAAAARKAHFLRLALKSARARRRTKNTTSKRSRTL